MFESTVKSILIIMMGLGASVCAAAGLGSPRPNPPVILSVLVDSAEHAMVISGRHFGKTAPTVSLADRILKVQSFSERKLIVDLPPGIGPATYSVTVTTNGPQRLASAPFSAAIFALAGR